MPGNGMSLLKPAVNSSANLKAGLLGFGGSGKTTTAALMAIALSVLHGKHKAVAMLDTETGSDFLIPLFKEHGIQFFVVKSRAFADLLTVFRESKGNVDALIIDSVTHVWKEVITAYQRRKNKQRLSMPDWGPIKEEWQAFTDAYVNAPFHAIICGRAGFEWDQEEDEDGHKELVKTGVKMKAESEVGFEPSLLIEMQRVPLAAAVTNDPSTHGWKQRAIVLKDRSHQMHGAMVDFYQRPGTPLSYEPVMKFLEPHLQYLNIGGEQLGVDSSRNSEHLFESKDSRSERKKQVEITLELIQDALIEGGIGGTAAKAKEEQIKQLKLAFGTSAWTAITHMRLEELQSGLRALRLNLKLDAPQAEDAPAPAPEGAEGAQAVA